MLFRTLHVSIGSEQSRAAARRKVANTLCQGSAADIVKAAMHRVLLLLHRNEPQPLYSETARMVMQMHDELVFEVRADRLREVTRLIIGAMESENQKQSKEFHLRVPLVVRTKIGRTWGNMQTWSHTQPLPINIEVDPEQQPNLELEAATHAQ